MTFPLVDRYSYNGSRRQTAILAEVAPAARQAGGERTVQSTPTPSHRHTRQTQPLPASTIESPALSWKPRLRGNPISMATRLRGNPVFVAPFPGSGDISFSDRNAAMQQQLERAGTSRYPGPHRATSPQAGEGETRRTASTPVSVLSQ